MTDRTPERVVEHVIRVHGYDPALTPAQMAAPIIAALRAEHMLVEEHAVGPVGSQWKLVRLDGLERRFRQVATRDYKSLYDVGGNYLTPRNAVRVVRGETQEPNRQ